MQANHTNPNKESFLMDTVFVSITAKCPICEQRIKILPIVIGKTVICNVCDSEFKVDFPKSKSVKSNKSSGKRKIIDSKKQVSAGAATKQENPSEFRMRGKPSPQTTDNNTSHHIENSNFNHPSPKKDIRNMQFAVATENKVQCPKCKYGFDITPEFYGAIGICQDCNCEFLVMPPEKFSKNTISSEAKNTVFSSIEAESEVSQKDVTSSGIEIDDNPPEFGLTGTLKMNKTMSMEPGKRVQDEHSKTPKPVKRKQSQIWEDPHLYAVAENRHVECPKCLTEFNISPKLYNSNRACLKCRCTFIIKPPGTQPYKKPSQSHISHSPNDGSDTQCKRHPPVTEILPGSEDIKRNHKPNLDCEHPPSTRDTTNMLSATATEEDDLGCPKCKYRFKIKPEFYGAIGVCQACDCEFLVLPPESSYNLN